ncbi:hypothetical protein HII13_004292 [Brettanomyces bruxellensis]|nr:hypothetical protein HII13_004292 [Brettanomyces bruxellensis]
MSLPFTPSKSGKKHTAGSEGSAGDLQSQFAELQKRLKRMPHAMVSESPSRNRGPRTNILNEDQSSSESEEEDATKDDDEEEEEDEEPIIRRRVRRGPKELASPTSPKRVDFLSDLSDGLLVESRRLAYENKQFKTQVEILKEERDKFKNQASNLGLLNTKLSEKESQSSDRIWELETKLSESKDKLEKALIDLERVGKAKSSLETQLADSTATLEGVRSQKIELEKQSNEKINTLKKQASDMRQRNSDLNDENDALQKKVGELKAKAGAVVAPMNFKDAFAGLGDNFDEATDNDASMLMEPEPTELNLAVDNAKELDRETLRANLSHAIMTIGRLRKYIQKQKVFHAKKLASPTLKTLAMSSPMTSTPIGSRTTGSPRGSRSVKRKLFQSGSGSSSPVKENVGENLERDWENFEDTSIATTKTTAGKLGHIPALVKNDNSDDDDEDDEDDKQEKQLRLQQGDKKALADELMERDISQRDFESSPSKKPAKNNSTFANWGMIAIPHGQSLDAIGEFDMVPFARGDYERLLKQQKRKAEKTVKIPPLKKKAVQGLRLVTSPEYKKLKKELETTTTELQRAKNKVEDIKSTAETQTESRDAKEYEVQVSNLRSRLSAKEKEVAELKEKLEEAEKEAAQNLQEKLSKKETEKEELRRSLQRTNNMAIRNLQEKLSKTESEKEELGRKLEDSQREAAQNLQEKLSSGQTEKNDLEKKLEQATSILEKKLSEKDVQIGVLQKKLEDSQSEAATTLQKRLSEKEAEADDLKNSLENKWKQASEDLEKKLSDKTAEMEEMKKKLNAAECLQKTLSHKEAEMGDLEKKLQDAQKEVVENSSAAHTLQEQVDSLKATIEKLREEVKTDEAEVARLWNLVGETKKEAGAIKDKISDKLSATEKELSALKQKYENPDESYLTSKASVLGFSTLPFEEQKKLRGDSKDKAVLQKLKQALELQIGELKEKAVQSEKKITEANKKQTDVLNELKMLKEVHKAPSAQYLKEKAVGLQLVAIPKLEYDNKNEELESTRKKLEESEKTCSNLKNEVEQAKEESSQLKTQHSEIEKKIALKANAFNESQKQLSAVNNTLSEREVKLVTLQSDLKEKQKEIDGLQQTLNRLKERNTTLDDSLTRLKRSYEKPDSGYVKQHADALGLALISKITSTESRDDESVFEDASEDPINIDSEKDISPRRSSSLSKVFSRSISQSKKLQKQLKEAQEQVKNLQKKLDKPTPEYIQSKCEFVGIANVSTGDYSKLKSNISALEDQLQKKEEKLNSVKQAHSQEAVLLKKLLEQKQNELSQLKSAQDAELEKQKALISNGSTELELKKNQLQTKITELATLKAELQGKSCDLESTSSKLTKCMDALKEKTSELEELTGEHQKLRVKLEKLESDYETAHEILEKPEKKFLEEKAGLLGLSLVASTEHSAVMKKAQEKESAVEQLNTAITRLNQEYSTAKADLGVAHNEINSLKKELDEAHVGLEKMEKENATNENLLTVKANRITALNLDLEKKNSDILKQSEELKRLKRELKSLEDEKSNLEQKNVSLSKTASSIPSGCVAIDIERFKNLLGAMSMLGVQFKQYAENLKSKDVDDEELKREISELKSAAEQQAKISSKYESPSVEYIEEKATNLGMKVLSVSEFISLKSENKENLIDKSENGDEASIVSEEAINEQNRILTEKMKSRADELEALQTDLKKKELTLKQLERRVEGTLDPEEAKDAELRNAESGSMPFTKISKLRKLLDVKHQEISSTEQKIIENDEVLSRIKKKGRHLSMEEIDTVDMQLDQKKKELEERKSLLTEKVRNLEIEIKRMQEDAKDKENVRPGGSISDQLDSVRAELKAKSNALDVLQKYIESNRQDASRAKAGTSELQMEIGELRVELRKQKREYNHIQQLLDRAIKSYEPELENRNREIGQLKTQLKNKAVELQELGAQEEAAKRQRKAAEKFVPKNEYDSLKEQLEKQRLQFENSETAASKKNASSPRTITSQELAIKAAEYGLALISEQELADLRQRSPATVEDINVAARKMNLLCIPEDKFVATTVCRKPDPATVVVLPLSYYVKLTKTHDWYKMNRDSIAEWQEMEREKTANRNGVNGKKVEDERVSLISSGSTSISSSLAAKRGSLGQQSSSRRAALKRKLHLSQEPPVNSPAFALSQLAKQDAADTESRLGDTSLHTVNTVISTRQEMVAAITQTIIGEYLFKYYRKLGPLVSSVSGTRHERYFWIHPYSLTLYWSTSNPSLSDPSENKIHALAIAKVKVVDDNNPLPPGLYHKSIIVYSNDRHSIKITCPTRQRHNIWFNSLQYLIAKSIADTNSDADTENQYNENFSLDERLQLERSQSFRHQQPRTSILRSGRMPRATSTASISDSSSFLQRQRSSFPSMSSLKRHLTRHNH